jgi:hypothetical protein
MKTRARRGAAKIRRLARPFRRGVARPSSRLGESEPTPPDWPRNGVLLRVKIRSADDQKRALAVIEVRGARMLDTSWRRGGR